MIVKRDFDAAHHLEDYIGKCSEIHGHRWEVEIYINVPDDKDLTIDFGDAKKIIDKYLPDHKYLNTIYDFNPTAENIAKYLKEQISRELPISKIIVWESPSSGAMI